MKGRKRQRDKETESGRQRDTYMREQFREKRSGEKAGGEGERRAMGVQQC